MRLGRDPSRDELATAMDWPIDVVEETEMAAKDIVRIEDVEHFVRDEFDPLEDIISARQKTVAVALAQIPERLQLVLSLRFVEEFSVKEVGDLLGVSKTRAHGLIQEALTAVRNQLGVDVPGGDDGGQHERAAEGATRKAAPVDGGAGAGEGPR